jgi:hypothetical protein
MPLSSAGETNVLTSLLTGRFVSLHIADPGNTGVSEVIGGSYARQSATFVSTGSNPTVASNSTLIQFPVATGLWGVITHFGIWSAVSAGTFLAYEAVAVPKTVNVDDIARWDIGKLSVITD